MEISSSSSDDEKVFENEIICMETDEQIESVFSRVFQKDEPISDNSEDNIISESNINSSSNPYFKDLNNFQKDNIDFKPTNEKGLVEIKNSGNKNKKDELNNINESENSISMIDTKDNHKIFKIYKDEDYVLFEPANNMENYKKYNSTKLPFNTWKNKPPRKEKPDEIRKKIKSRFFNSLKICINKLLESQLTQKKFEFLPQNFISDITKHVNKNMLEKTLEEIILEYKDEKSEKKYENNKNLLKYLKEKEKNNAINNKKMRIYNIFNSTIKKLFNEYLTSKEFDKSLLKLKEEGNYVEYIKDYIYNAKDFVNYFSN